jgi:hypothetical protein
MNIGDKRDVDALLDFAKCGNGFFIGNGDAHDFAACFFEAVDLFHGRFDVARVGGSHGLDGNRMIPADGDFSNVDFAYVGGVGHVRHSFTLSHLFGRFRQRPVLLHSLVGDFLYLFAGKIVLAGKDIAVAPSHIPVSCCTIPSQDNLIPNGQTFLF